MIKSKAVWSSAVATLLALVLPPWATAYAANSHLDVVKQRGHLICGTDNTKPGFGYLDPKTSKLEGFDVDFCRAEAAAIFGSPDKVKFVILTDKNRFNAIQTGEVDVVFFHTTITTTRDSAVGVDFLPVNFYDGTGVLVKKSLGIQHVAGLNGATICTTQGSTTEAEWSDYIKAHNWKSSTKLLTYQDLDKLFAALMSGRCNAMTTDKSALVGWKGNAPDPSALEILPETMSKEPLAGFTYQDDSRWRDALTWVVYGTVQAEEYGINSKNLAQYVKSQSPDIQRFLGVSGSLGQDLGLPNDFMHNVIGGVGNYGEIYARNVGPKTPYWIQRKGSLNALWTHGGLMYSPPFR
jgi:general L-amino acid transport system substrate-binding protein